jgi:hypothetical protein
MSRVTTCAAITLQEMEWIICRYMHGNMRGKSVKSIKIRGKIRGSHGSILTDTDTNGYGYIRILAIA